MNLITADGQTLTVDGDGYQYTPEGFNTGLATNSVPLALWDGSGGSYGRLYETQPNVARAVNKLARQVARMPLKVYTGDSGSGKQRVTEGSLVDAIKRPAPRKSAIDFKQWLTLPVLLHGNALVEKIRTRRGGPIVGFWPLNWRQMVPKWIDDDPEQPIDYWTHYPAKGKPRVIFPQDVIHIAWQPPAGQLGVSPLKQLGVTLTIERAAQAWQAMSFKNSARPSGGVTLPDGKLATDKQFRAELRDELQQLVQGAANAGRPIVLPPGGKWEAFSHSAAEAELINQRKLALDEVAGVYDVPPPMIGILEKATFSNITEQHQMLFTDVLGPWFSLEQEGINSQVCAEEPGLEEQWVEYDLRDVLRGDPVRAALAEKTQISTGTLTIDEARDANNRPRFGGNAEKPLIAANNLSTLDSLGSEASADGPTVPTNSDQATALMASLDRVSDRLFRQARAGQEGWDSQRFADELTADLVAAGAEHDDAESWAQEWTEAIDGILRAAAGDAERIRTALADLTTTISLEAA